jgi:hypothetical protein
MSVQVVTEFPCHQSHAPSVVTRRPDFRDVGRLFQPGLPFHHNTPVSSHMGSSYWPVVGRWET